MSFPICEVTSEKDRNYMKNKIIQVAMETINLHGWKKFTIDDIASRLGISKKTIYRYFDTKDDIISAVVDQYMQMENIGASKVFEAEGSWSDKLRVIISVFAPQKPGWVTDELQRFFPQEWAKVEDSRKLRSAQFKELFLKSRENGEIRSDISPEMIELTCAGVMKLLYNYEILKQIDMTFSQAVEEFKKILFEGILISKDKYEDWEFNKFPPNDSAMANNSEKDYTRTRIILAARDKTNQYGFRKFTIEDIAFELGISKKTIYRYFATKDKLISAVVDINIQQEKAGVLKALELEDSWIRKLQTLMFTYVPERPVWVTEEIERFFPQEWHKIQTMRRWRKPIMTEVLMKAVQNGEIRSDISPEIILLTMGGTFLALVDSSNLKRIDKTYNQAVVEFNRILYTGILTKLN